MEQNRWGEAGNRWEQRRLQLQHKKHHDDQIHFDDNKT